MLPASFREIANQFLEHLRGEQRAEFLLYRSALDYLHEKRTVVLSLPWESPLDFMELIVALKYYWNCESGYECAKRLKKSFRRLVQQLGREHRRNPFKRRLRREMRGLIRAYQRQNRRSLTAREGLYSDF